MWIEKFEVEQKEMSKSTTQTMQLTTKIQDRDLKLSNLGLRIKAQLEQMDLLTEQVSQANSNVNEKQMEMEAMRREETYLKATHETLISQKKEYIKKLLKELEQNRVLIVSCINQEEMVAEDFRSRCEVFH